MSNRVAVMAIVGLATLLVSCGSDDGTGLGASGTFTATVTGTVTGSLSGSAAFNPTAVGGVALVIALIDLSFNGVQASIAIVGPASLPTGTYLIEKSPMVGNVFEATFGLSGPLGPEAELTFLSESGSLTITAASGDRLEGSFNFEAKTVNVEEKSGFVSSAVTVEGTFSAVLEPELLPSASVAVLHSPEAPSYGSKVPQSRTIGFGQNGQGSRGGGLGGG